MSACVNQRITVLTAAWTTALMTAVEIVETVPAVALGDNSASVLQDSLGWRAKWRPVPSCALAMVHALELGKMPAASVTVTLWVQAASAASTALDAAVMDVATSTTRNVCAKRAGRALTVAHCAVQTIALDKALAMVLLANACARCTTVVTTVAKWNAVGMVPRWMASAVVTTTGRGNPARCLSAARWEENRWAVVVSATQDLQAVFATSGRVPATAVAMEGALMALAAATRAGLHWTAAFTKMVRRPTSAAFIAHTIASECVKRRSAAMHLQRSTAVVTATARQTARKAALRHPVSSTNRHLHTSTFIKMLCQCLLTGSKRSMTNMGRRKAWAMLVS